MNDIHLILGGARSGKSRLAENVAKHVESQGLTVCYLATAQAHDEEMQQRITQHQADRPQHWPLIESPLFQPDYLRLQPLILQILLLSDDETQVPRPSPLFYNRGS